ncbi:hypothetical protein BO71DRAFT_401991 [Aspergillus ellipticus CBS 707.79]|uniref:GPI anchored cell wall protein n=1 Tax=Aspergillus ellipticus CBS 707.79 TaxID=1448320 RepID=A0A319D0A3_9EURO|nr:hypothetical protein BO71DRAFT_401991 [Aspergillus ellipticus CBS 707.79]
MQSLTTLTTTLLPLLATLSAATTTTTTAASGGTTTLNLFNGGETTLAISGMDASVVGVTSGLTTLAINCGTATTDTVCALHSPVTITEGPSTFTMSAVYATSTGDVEETITLVQDCAITSSTQAASCSISAGIHVTYEGMSSSTAVSTVTSLASSEIYYQPVTVTAGAEKLNQAKTTGDAGNAGAKGFGGLKGMGAVVGAVVAGLGAL